MKVLILILIAFIFSGCRNDTSEVKLSDEEQIRSLSLQWTNAIIEKDVDEIVSLYAPDAVQLQSDIPMLKGRDEIRKWYNSWVMDSTLIYSAVTEFVDIAESKDLAYERGTYSMEMTLSDTEKVKENGRYITIWKKINEDWKAVSDMSVTE